MPLSEPPPPSARFEFPKMLYNMLEECTFNDDYCEIISWQPHGLAFKVHNRDKLERILPNWFREKYESFLNLLDQWGFLKLSKGKDRGCWYHKMFYHRASFSSSLEFYELAKKEDFLKGMPEYISFRNEPDLDKESNEDNRIFSKKRKMQQRIDFYGGDRSNLGKSTKKQKSKSKKQHEDYLSNTDIETTIYTDESSLSETDSSKHTDSGLSEDSSISSNDSGCQVCGLNDDHANLLLCEGCDREIHTYCLDPPLHKVPDDEWFCDVCRARIVDSQTDIEKLMRKVPKEMKERFGEMCFAKSSERAQWWPAMIFHPQSFLHNPHVVQLMRKYLGKRHLVFLFENKDAFVAVRRTWIMKWEEGLNLEFDKGRSISNGSKSRRHQFEKAMSVANAIIADIAANGCSDSDESDVEVSSDEGNKSVINRKYSNEQRYRKASGGAQFLDREPNVDWRSIRNEVIDETEATYPSEYPRIVPPDLKRCIRMAPSGKPEVKVTIRGRRFHVGTFSSESQAAFALDLFKNRMEQSLVSLVEESSDSSDYDEDTVRVSIDGRPLESEKDKSSPFGKFTDKRPKVAHRALKRLTSTPQGKLTIVHSLSAPQMDKEGSKKKTKEGNDLHFTDSTQPPGVDETTWHVANDVEDASDPMGNEDTGSELEIDTVSHERVRVRRSANLAPRQKRELLVNASFCGYYLPSLSEM